MMTTTTGKAAVSQPRQKRQAPPATPLTWLGRPWRNRAWLHPLYGSGVVFAAGQVLHETGLADNQHWMLKGVIAVAMPAVGGAAGVLAAAGHRFADAARGYFAAAGTAAGGWLSAAMLVSPYSAWTAWSALAGTVLAFAAYPAVRHAQLAFEARYRALRTDPMQQPAPLPSVESVAPKDPEAAKWERLTAKVGLPGMKYRDRVENRAGFAVLFSLPGSGRVTFTTVANRCEALEIAAKMPAGTVRAERAFSLEGRPLASEVWIHFDVEDILTKTLMMPDEHTELSVNEAFPVGLYADGEPIYLKLREIAALIVGVRGRGKTNLLNVIIHQLSRCVDVTLWMIDLKGGRAAKPWLRPWLDGRVKRPVLDWVATTRVEAHRMLVGAHALIEQRSNAGYGGSKIKPSRSRPAVIVICDEIAALVGQHARGQRGDGGPKLADLIALLTLCIQLGRSEAVDFVLATQRGTVTMAGSGDLKSQCELRAGLGVTSAQDAQSVFTGNSVAAKLLAKLKDKATRGAVLIQDGDGGRISPGKSYFMGDDDDLIRRIYQAATLHALFPAPLDEDGARTVDAAVRNLYDGTGYLGDDGRWSEARAAHLYSDEMSPEYVDADDATPAEPMQRAGAGRGDGGVRFMPSKQEREQRRQRREREHYDAEWAKIVAHFEVVGEDVPADTAPADSDEAALDKRRYEAMIRIIRDAGAEGIRAGMILAQMDRESVAWEARTSIYPALKRALADGEIVQPAGPRGAYCTPENVE